MNAGPLAERPVIASIFFSSTTTVLPTASKSFCAVSIFFSVANFPFVRAVTPSPTIAGVFGMARITGTFFFSRASMNSVGTDAATEMSSLLSSRSSAISSSTLPTVCGFTHSSTTFAFFVAARLSVPTEKAGFDEFFRFKSFR